jgi:glycosyltransferase involved in cell wall biosynthesis
MNHQNSLRKNDDMHDVIILIKKDNVTQAQNAMPYPSANTTTGVTVSSDHLKAVLGKAGTDCVIMYYADDNGLLEAVKGNDAGLYILQIPTFSHDTLSSVLKLGKNIVLGIHSTICNLQVEENALRRLLRFSQLRERHFAISCPSKLEVNGFNSFSATPFIYLPNTYSFPIKAHIKKRKLNPELIKISLFCALRSFKNIMAQVVAVSLLAKRGFKIELHLIDDQSHIAGCIKEIADSLPYKVIFHELADNKALLKLMAKMDLGLQVSLSETFSYAAFEQMALGVPIVASTAVPYATQIAKFNSAESMANKMHKIIKNEKTYQKYCKQTLSRAIILQKQINIRAVSAIKTAMRKGLP